MYIYNVRIPKEFVFIAKNISYINTIYKENDSVIIHSDEQNNIDVLIIQAIFLNKSYDEAIFYGTTMKMWYNQDLILYQSYDSEKVDSWVRMKELLHTKPLRMHKYKRHFFISDFHLQFIIPTY